MQASAAHWAEAWCTGRVRSCQSLKLRAAHCQPRSPPAAMEVERTKAAAEPAFLHQGQLVSFSNLVYSVINSTNKKQTIQLLDSVSGYLRTGEMCALMGEAGGARGRTLAAMHGLPPPPLPKGRGPAHSTQSISLPPLPHLPGPSGSGKTTLLDVLAGRKTVGSMTGEILFGGNKPTKMYLRRFTGYVEQFGTRALLLPPAIGSPGWTASAHGGWWLRLDHLTAQRTRS